MFILKTSLMPKLISDRGMNFILFCVLFLVVSCNVDKSKKVNKSNLTFKTTQASRLFFLNVRQKDYQKETLIGTKIDVYRWKGWPDLDNGIQVKLAIVDNWLEDEAYIVLEPNEVLKEIEPWVIQVQDSAERTIEYIPGNKTVQLSFASSIYKVLQDKRMMQILINSDTVNFLDEASERERFRKTMLDFYRLTENL